MATDTVQIPIINLKDAAIDKQKVAKELVTALETVGFIYIDGVEGFDFESLFPCCKWFFGLSKEYKETLSRNFWNSKNSNLFRGYFPVVEGAPSRKEGFEFGRDVDQNDPTVKPGNWIYEPSVWPKEDGTFPFKQYLTDCYNILHNVALEILHLTATGIGISEDSYDDIFTDKPCSTFRLMHYPPWNENPPANARIEDGKVVCTPDHTDSGCITLLYVFQYPGLEILSDNGQWIAVPPRDRSFIMNIGDVFSRLMNGRFKSTRHRVIDIGADRYSVPFFFEPSYDGNISPTFMDKMTGKLKKGEVERYGPWMVNRIKYEKKFAEYVNLPDIE